ncbi:hypothetical protein ACZ87_02528 [Candidatus Erwinia dacicola]|uniref:Integrase DNA-binding domain-containing protein n=2 Tax=Candidatus Erwinia dacicola TaxID=252393 RepID=A0A328TS95_9GAMM|nr:hypothetical protein ACZ87_02528 [Candidatus Erwinia dacicola]
MIMAISETKLSSIYYGKAYSGTPEIIDSDGLGVGITPRGIINFQYRYRWLGKQRRIGIGKHPAIFLRDTRNKVADLRESLDRSIDPKVIADKVESVKVAWALFSSVCTNTCCIAAFRPLCSSEMTSFTPSRPRSFRLSRKASQNAFASDSLIPIQMISQRLSELTAQAIIRGSTPEPPKFPLPQFQPGNQLI